MNSIIRTNHPGSTRKNEFSTKAIFFWGGGSSRNGGVMQAGGIATFFKLNLEIEFLLPPLSQCCRSAVLRLLGAASCGKIKK